MNHLELFSGTHSFGKVSSKLDYNVISLDMNLDAECPLNSGYISDTHIKEDIMTWNYKIYPKGHFKLITASPVCLWWSNIRNTWIGRKLNSHGDTIITKEILEEDIEKYGVPMVDKVFEILEYFKPDYYLIENPYTGKMKKYINDLVPYYDVDYCKYSNWGYKKKTRIWTNIEGFISKKCKNDCINMIISNNQKLHRNRMGSGRTIIDNNKIIRVNTAELRKKYRNYKDCSKDYSVCENILERYRIPPKLIEELLKLI